MRKLGCFGENRGRLKSPSGITYLNDDEILVASNSNHRIQKFNIETGKCMKSFGKCGTEEGQFNAVSICVDGKGQVIVADFNNKRMQVLTSDGKPMFTFGDSGSSLLSQHTSCIYHKNMFIVSYCWDHCLKVFESSGQLLYKIEKMARQMDSFPNLGVYVLSNMAIVRIFLYAMVTMVAFSS